MNKKIVFFTGAMGRGGAERVISILTKHMCDNGWNVIIIMLLHNITDGYCLDERVKVISFLPDKPLSTIKKILINIKKVRSYIKKENPDVVVSFMAQNTLVSGIACSGLNVRYIASERIDPSMVKRNFLYKKFIERIYEKADKVIFQTERAKKYFCKKIQDNGVIIGNPVSVECSALAERKKKIVNVGRITAQKNQRLLIDAFSKVSEKYPEYTLEIFGEGPFKEQLENQIETLNLTGKVFLKGSTRTLHKSIADAELFVLSSDFEGLSNALMEAMLMGIACVSTNCAGSDEIIESGKNGLLVDIGDCEGLEKVIINLIENVELRKGIEQNAVKSMDKYKTENIIKEWMKIIEG